jgi:hypothetical protein
MLRVEMHDAANAVVMKVEGRFTGEYAEYARSLVTHCNVSMRLIVDLAEVTAVDAVGEEVLLFFGRLGANFIADNVYARYLCERLHLPLTRVPRGTSRRRDAHGAAASD